MIRTVIIAAALIGPGLAVAQGLEVQPVTEGVWAIVGEKEQRSPENLGNNATFGVVVTGDGAVLIDPGGSWNGAEALHAAIRTVTDQPCRHRHRYRRAGSPVARKRLLAVAGGDRHCVRGCSRGTSVRADRCR